MPDFCTSSSSSRHSQLANPPPGVQRGVILNKLWPITTVDDRPTTVVKFYFVDGTESKKKAVRTTIQKSARDAAKKKYDQDAGSSSGSKGNNPFDFVTWEDCANIEFQEMTDKAGSDIRITFKGSGFDSAIGTDAQDDECKDDSMILAGLADTYPPSPAHRRSILHEFGHVLGLDHEHQGPAARKWLKLNEELVKNARGEKYAKDNILDEVEEDEDLWNYTDFDKLSIMTYPIEEAWQEQAEKIRIGLVLELSDVDQACTKLMYPPDLREPENQASFKKALCTLGVDQWTAGDIISIFLKNVDDDIAVRLTNMRNRFYSWQTGRTLYNPDMDIMSGIDPTSPRRSGINAFVGGVTRDKLFQSIVKIIVYRTMVQHGIPTKMSIPGAAQTEVTKLIAALSMRDDVGQLVKQRTVAFSGPRDCSSVEVTTTETLAN